MVFHEITPSAIAGAVANPREIDGQLVDAQHTRQILDRLVRLRGQPGAVEEGAAAAVRRPRAVGRHPHGGRARARSGWRSAPPTTGTSSAPSPPSSRKPGDPRDLHRHAGRRSTTPGWPPAATSTRPPDARRPTSCTWTRPAPAVWPRGWQDRPFSRRTASRRSRTAAGRTPPFMTSTLQQEAGRKFRWSAQQVMRTAQRLYENGYITYMRTDSTNLSETALTAARTQARELYGDAYVPAEPRIYTRKVKNAQEAHEAIRPAGDSFRTPGQVANQLSSDEFRLYELIWQRTLASQMSDAVGTTVSVRLAGDLGRRTSRSCSRRPAARSPSPASCAPTSRTPTTAAEKDDAEKRLPQLARGDALDAPRVRCRPATRPRRRPATPSRRWSRRMEELGVGRPSTYASIMQTIQDRGYVWKKGAGAGPDLDGVRRDRAARGLLRPAGRLRLHRLGRERPGRHRRRRALARRLAAPVLLRRRRGREPPTTRPASPRRAG